MKTYIIDEIDIEKSHTFLDSLQKDEEAQVYIDSYGWITYKFISITDRMNRMVDEWYNICMRAICVGSSAFQMLWEFKWKKYMERGVYWIIHVSACEYHIFNVDNEVRVRVNDSVSIARAKENYNIVDYPFLTEDERKDYLNWRDIYIDESRMKNIFNSK